MWRDIDSGRALREINRARLPQLNFDTAIFQSWRRPEIPFAVEIGCGVGLHPIRWAEENQRSETWGQILAVERTTAKFEKFQRRLANHPELKNIWAAHGDASVLLPQILTPNSVRTFYCLYPNPEPKSPNRRLGRSPLLKFILETLEPGGSLLCATNIESYARELAANAVTAGFAASAVGDVSPTAAPRSHFEKKYVERGERCFDVICRK